MRKILAIGGTLALGTPVAGFLASTSGVLAFFGWHAVILYYIPL